MQESIASGIARPSVRPSAAARKRFQRRIESQLPVLVVAPDGVIRHTTRAARRLLAYADEQLHASFFSLVHTKNLYRVMRDVADMVCFGKQRASWLLRMRTGEGGWQWVQASARSELGSEEQPGILILLKAV